MLIIRLNTTQIETDMCIMMLQYKMRSDYPIVLAANRDEYYNRESQAPSLLHAAPMIWGGRDLKAGGTWLGVNEYGLVVGLTNRRLNDDQETLPDRRSRGLICLEALQHARASDVAESLASEPPDRYNDFNLLLLDPHTALWVAYDGKPEVQSIEPGFHILANGNLNDMTKARPQRAQQLLHSHVSDGTAATLSRMQDICSDHESDMTDRDALCMHRDSKQYGTVSSTILAIASTRWQSQYHYADQHPCQADYQDYSTFFTCGHEDWSLPC